MKFTKKYIICLLCLTLVFSCAVAYANTAHQVTIVNKSGHLLYIYDFDLSKKTDKKTPLLKQLAIGQSYELTMKPPSDRSPGTPARTIYFASDHLKAIENGFQPDPLNPDTDGNVMFSFVEYNYEPANNRYTMDVSYVDVFSYPVTLTFSNVPTSYKSCQNNFEYGPTSFSAITKALSAQGEPWSKLVWTTTTNPANNSGWKQGIHRVVTPDKLWPFTNSLPPHIPQNYHDFYQTLPPYGTKLFNSTTNLNGWLTFTEHNPAIFNTGYVKALHSVSKPDVNKKYGFFAFPNDNVNGEFTYVPSSVQCTINVYPHDK